MTQVKINYKGMWPDLKCRMCKQHKEDLSHVLQCDPAGDKELGSEVQQILDNIQQTDKLKVKNLAIQILRTILRTMNNWWRLKHQSLHYHQLDLVEYLRNEVDTY